VSESKIVKENYVDEEQMGESSNTSQYFITRNSAVHLVT